VTPSDDLPLDRAHALMMAALDGECSAEERGELERLLAGHPELSAEWNRLRRLKEVTVTMGLRQPPEEVWDRYRASVLHRTERSIAWILIVLGAAALGGTAFWLWLEAWLASDVPLVAKVASVALIAGGVLLAVSVIRERLFLHRRDPYSKEVTR